MAIVYNTSVVRSGAVFYLDAANSKTYQGAPPQNAINIVNLVPDSGGAVFQKSPNVNYSTDNGGVFVFNGQGGSISSLSTPFNPPIEPQNFTMEAWAYFDNPTPNPDAGRVIFWLTNFGGSSIYLTKWYSNINGVGITFAIGQNVITTVDDMFPGIINKTVTSTPYNPNGKWSYIVATCRSSTLYLYINSVMYGSMSLNTPTFFASSLSVGRSVQGGGSMLGRISSVKIFNNKGFTEQEIRQNFEAYRGRFGL